MTPARLPAARGGSRARDPRARVPDRKASNMNLGTLIAYSVVLASFGALTATADQLLCTPGYEACATTYGTEYGEGACGDTPSYFVSYSGVSVAANANGEYRAIGAQYGCFSDSYWGQYDASWFDVYTYGYGANYNYAEFYWYGYSGDFGEGCGSALYTWGLDPVPTYTDLGCNAGAPPTGLPVLP